MKLGYITDFFGQSHRRAPAPPPPESSSTSNAASHSQKGDNIANIGVVASHAT